MNSRDDSGARERERVLVASCVAGEPRAAAQLVAGYRPFVVRVARSALARAEHDDGELAEDVADEVFTELLADGRRALSRFRAPHSFTAWLAVVTRRRAMRILRKLPNQELLGDPEQVGAGNRSVASDVAELEQQELVRRLVQALSTRDRLALQLFYEGGRSYKEVARIVGIPPAHVGMLLSRARERLARSLRIAV